jgi:hypothetical protein
MKYRVYRRTFVQISALSGLGALALPACCDAGVGPGDAIELSAEERELMERFAEVFLPTDGTSLKPLSEVPVVDNIEHAFSLIDEPTLEQVRIGLKLFNYGSIVIGFHFARFVHLSAEDRLNYIHRWEQGVGVQRGIVGVLKKLMYFGYWQDIEAARAIGYQGPVSVASRLQSLGNAPMPRGSRP